MRLIRIFDILFSSAGLIILSPLLFVLLLLGFIDTYSPLFQQERMGLNKKPFKLYKFRSMHKNTQELATHLIKPNSITFWGYFLRNSKLDELPQLWNVLVGDMSFVGPRPNLCNQVDLIKERDTLGVYSKRPGITGLAQISKIDMSTSRLLAETDAKMIKDLTIIVYFKYILLTILGNGFGDRIKE